MQFFDLSPGCRGQLNGIYERATVFSSYDESDTRARRRLVDALMNGLARLDELTGTVTFCLELHRRHLRAETQAGDLFYLLAGAVCMEGRAGVSDFASDPRMCSWKTGRCILVAYAQINPHSPADLVWFLRMSPFALTPAALERRVSALEEQHRRRCVAYKY